VTKLTFIDYEVVEYKNI